MQPTVILFSVFAIFIPALMVPGPDFVAVVRSSMTRGATGGLLTTVGVSIGLGLYAALGLLGLSALLVRFEWLAWAIRLVGGAYLSYLGVKLLFAGRHAAGMAEAGQGRRGNPLLFGLGVTLTNPKAIMLFASVFATSVTSQTPGWLMATMVALVVASAFSWFSIVSLFMSSAPVMRRFVHAQHWIERVAGMCFVVVGGKLLADSRNPLTP